MKDFISFVVMVKDRNPYLLQNTLWKMERLSPWHCEVIVVSQDKSTINWDLGRAHYIHVPHDRINISLALNIGIRESLGDIIACTGSEMLFSSGYERVILSKMMEYDYLCSDCGYLTEDVTNNLSRGIRPLDHEWDDLWPDLCASARGLDHKGRIDDVSPRRTIGGLQCAPRDWWFEVHGYNEKLPFAYTDSDLEGRAKMCGLKIGKIKWDEAQMLHQWHEKSKYLRFTSGDKKEYENAQVVRNLSGWGGKKWRTR